MVGGHFRPYGGWFDFLLLMKSFKSVEKLVNSAGITRTNSLSMVYANSRNHLLRALFFVLVRLISGA
jgi:hypothetical protein